MPQTDILLVCIGSTAGLRAAETELEGALRRAGARVEAVAARAPRDVRTFALTDLAWARAARVTAMAGIAEHDPRTVLYSTVTSALLWPRPGAIRYDAPAAANRPGRHGIWQRPLERRRLAQASLLVPQDPRALAETPRPHAAVVVVPIPVEPSAPTDAPRDVAAITYAANPHKKGLDRVLAAWARARRGGEELVVAGADLRIDAPGVRVAGRMEPEAYRALLRRSRVFVCAPRREDYGLAQLEALADGCMLVTTTAPGPYAALPLAGGLDPRLVVEDGSGASAVGDVLPRGDLDAARRAVPRRDVVAGLAHALRDALDAPVADYAERAAVAIAPYRRAAVDAVVRDELLPRLLS